MRLFCFLLCSHYSYKHYLCMCGGYQKPDGAGKKNGKKTVQEGFFERKRQRKKGVVKSCLGRDV